MDKTFIDVLRKFISVVIWFTLYPVTYVKRESGLLDPETPMLYNIWLFGIIYLKCYYSKNGHKIFCWVINQKNKNFEVYYKKTLHYIHTS